MPELPEVETVRRIVEPQLTGRTIEGVDLRRSEVLAHPTAEQFHRMALGATFTGAGRRGKYLLFHLDSGDRLVLHLRMTGELLVAPADLPMEKHTHAVFHLGDGNQLRYTDVRRFGRFWLLRRDETDTFTGMDKLGPEPFDAGCSAGYLREAMGARKRAVKECLLDQTILAGIGNIYADEILYAARIYPGRPAATLREADWQALTESIPFVLDWAIEGNRMTTEEYLAGRGREYRNTPLFNVYGRKGAPCPRCGTPLERTVIGGRGTCYCPRCQQSEAR